MVEVQLIKVWLKICKNIRTVNMYLPYVCCYWKLQCVLSWRSIERSCILLLVSNHMKHWWLSGLKYYIQNQKISGSNRTRCSAGLWDATSLLGSQYPPGWNKKVEFFDVIAMSRENCSTSKTLYEVTNKKLILIFPGKTAIILVWLV